MPAGQCGFLLVHWSFFILTKMWSFFLRTSLANPAADTITLQRIKFPSQETQRNFGEDLPSKASLGAKSNTHTHTNTHTHPPTHPPTHTHPLRSCNFTFKSTKQCSVSQLLVFTHASLTVTIQRFTVSVEFLVPLEPNHSLAVQ